MYFGGSSGSVYQTTDGGSSFRPLSTPASGSYISSLDIAPGSPANLAIAANNPPWLSPMRKVLVTTHALDPTVTFQDVTGTNLPSRFVTRVAFDPNDPTVIYVTLAGFGVGHVFRKTITDANWTDISPAVDIPVNAIALDGGSNPAVLYIGTDLGVLRRSVADGAAWEVVDDLHLPNATVSDLEINTQAGVLRAATWGRGVFELAAPSGPVISVVETSLTFGPTCAVTGADQSIHVSSVGTDNLVVSSVQRISGSPSFTVVPTPSTPLTIAPGGGATFTVHYTPTVPGMAESAIIRVSSNDPAVPFVDLVATGSLETTPPTITCPTSVNAVGTVSCPIATTATANFTVTATDNCPGAVNIVCKNQNNQVVTSGQSFPVGTTTVTCTATDAAGNTASCSFNVNTFSFCLQDETNPGNVVLVNAQTGDFTFCCNGVTIASGRGTLTTKDCIGSIDQAKGDRRAHIQWDTSVNFNTGSGTAIVQKSPSLTTICQITDKKMSSNSCHAPVGHERGIARKKSRVSRQTGLPVPSAKHASGIQMH